jgi:gluconate 2-dehydrogenase gamma chain
MDRRKSIKALAVGTISAGVLVEACKEPDKKAEEAKKSGDGKTGIDRTPEEKAADQALMGRKFFNEHEMATIAVLADIIIPRDDVSGSATDAKVPEFIEFIVKDMPHHQVPMRGGLRWLDVQCMKRFGKSFKESGSARQLEIVDEIAYPAKAKPGMKQGVSFFNLMRNLTATGFYTSEIGVKDLGYAGNKPNLWKGVPDDVLKQYGVAYTERELKECI